MTALEEVERRVETELRVGGARRRAVEPHEHDLPARCRRETGEETQDDRDSPCGEAAERFDELLVAVELARELGVHRAQAVGQLDRDPDGHGHGDEAHQEHAQGGEPSGRQDGCITELVVPEEIGV
jgi:hypothetical protein